MYTFNCGAPVYSPVFLISTESCIAGSISNPSLSLGDLGLSAARSLKIYALYLLLRDFAYFH